MGSDHRRGLQRYEGHDSVFPSMAKAIFESKVLFRPDPVVTIRVNGVEKVIPPENVNFRTGVVTIPQEHLDAMKRQESIDRLTGSMNNCLAAVKAQQDTWQEEKNRLRKARQAKKAPKIGEGQNYLSLKKGKW